MSQLAYATVSTGHIVNLVTSDVQILERVKCHRHLLRLKYPIIELVDTALYYLTKDALATCMNS